MKFFNKIASLLMLTAMVTSCSQEALESDVALDSSSDRVVTFTVNEPADTRGSILVNSTFTSFNVYLVNSDEEGYSSLSMSKDDSGFWTLNGIMTLPESGTSTFYAVSTSTTTSGVEFKVDNGVGYVSYTMPTTVSEQPTILMSAPVTLEADATSFNVSLSFSRTLSYVGFTASGDYDIKSLSISNFYNGADIAFDDSYGVDSFSNYTSATLAQGFTLLTDAATEYLMIPLQDLEGAVVKADLYYNNDYVETKEITLPANEHLLTSGYCYTYNIDTDTYVAPDYITPGEGYEDSDNNGAYELGDILVGDEVTAVVETNSTLTWASSNENVATVDSNGVVTGIGGGTATITATSKTDGVVISFEVTVWIPIDGANISIPTDQTNTLDVAATLELYATAVYEGAYSIYHEPFTVTDWSSSDITVATVATTAVTTGTVTGVAAGDATITLTIKGNLSGNERSTTRTVTVEAGSFYNYGDLSIGQYVKSDGSISDSSSGAVAVIYYVASDYALAASLTISSTSTTQWCPSSYTSSYIGATSTTDGYSNSAKMYAQSSTSSYATNPVSYAKYKGTISGAYDGKGKGEFYLPSRCEAYLFISKLFSGTSITMSETSYATTFSGTKSSIYNNNSSVYGSIAYIVTSTETSSTQCNIVAGDGSGATTSKLKDSYKNLSTSTWAPTVKILPIVKL